MSFIDHLSKWLRKITKSFAEASINGNVITLTRHNGESTTLTTQDTTYGDATSNISGLMSAADKRKLDNIDLTPYAFIDSPDFTGVPTAPTPVTNDNSERIATTAFVNSRLPYSNGNWTPILSGSISEGKFTYSAQKGRYTRIGNMVFIFARVDFYTITQPTGDVYINGLPFVSAGSVINYGWQPFFNVRGYGGVSGCLFSIQQAVVSYNSTRIGLRKSFNYQGIIRTDSAEFSTTTTDKCVQLNSNLGRFDISGIYFTQ